MNNKPIGLFDSGVGGLSILLEIKEKLPKESFVFLADQAHNPYGAKSPKRLKDLSERIVRFLLKSDIKLLVIACNTATCYTLAHLRSKFKIPIIGVVPALKPAVSLSKNARIVIMSTPATAKSAYLKDLVLRYAESSRVLRLGCDGLQDAIEYLKKNEIDRLLDIYVAKIEKFGADVIVLGCTHFPFVKDEIRKRIGSKARIIDSGAAIARRVKVSLGKEHLYASKKLPDRYFTTADPKVFSQVASFLLKHKIIAKKINI